MKASYGVPLLKVSIFFKSTYCQTEFDCVHMVKYFCYHLSHNYFDLSDLYVVLSDRYLYVDVSDIYVDLSLIQLF